ncbi:hypothetical protein B0S90_1027 [Caldicellulosiruptor bescii]|uniref:Uncharacterized protein n=2 Tax=Caldicellulosiruptor bescii TaxID=31899 RepID=B9MQ62_CALBD|nr:hypothetical protein [Caldicellulosiruptor bescii]ACM59854.1 hypothetical protein Athe_0739 [Caldicellulosiruptor bescii DSM 6725]PBC87264.1 hypothetical protein B0S87_0155 [Caldicellulosiruptor bescii]PBC90204.1 hypothetical protein B0S89_0529 [Caldicellulosiruptor bescii]PBD04368.1 hypothetical protein B0S85_2020 [Caldicellulosiruptor bescii]PBD06001.1 hypothetical protein B0S90_1027 [Caldicellulosiruptor bescii]
MPKVTVNIPKPVYDKLCKLAVEGRTLDEIVTHASGILIDTIRRATKRELETAHWFTIASAIDMDYRKLLIAFLDQGTELFSSVFIKNLKVGNNRETSQCLRTLILLEYLKECIHNEGIVNLVELRYPPLDEELKFWQDKGFTIPENILLKSNSESEAVYQ